MGEGGGSARSGEDQGRLARVERQLAIAQQITHIGSWEWDVATNAVTWSDELYRIYGFEPQSRDITFEFFLSRLHPDDRARVQAEVGGALARGTRFAYPERIVRPDGSVRRLDTVGEVARDAGGRPVGLIGTCRDVTDERLRDEAMTVARRLKDAEYHVLERIASGAPLAETLEAIAAAVEEHSPPILASVLLLDADGLRVEHGAAPSLPPAYVAAIDGLPIGPRAGSCGTAAFLRKPVFVEDIETDPLWADYRAIARAHGLRSCWSTPIFSNDGLVLGTFALYDRTPRMPSADDRALIDRATHLAGIAIEQRQLEDQLRALSARVESVREDERTGIAREIHDVLGQALTALKMDLAFVAKRSSGDVLEKVEAMAQATDAIIQQVRRISAELRPGVLDDLGLLAAIEWQAQEFEERTGVLCVLESDLGDRRLPRDVATALFRVFQEALTNVARHAHATRVDIRLHVTGSSLRLAIHDDGEGITPASLANPRSLGLLGMRERARRLGGRASVAAGGRGGTSVLVEVPLGSAP